MSMPIRTAYRDAICDVHIQIHDFRMSDMLGDSLQLFNLFVNNQCMHIGCEFMSQWECLCYFPTVYSISGFGMEGTK